MSDQGLSIFDDNEPDEDETAAANDATQVMPASCRPAARPTPPRQRAPAAPAGARPPAR